MTDEVEVAKCLAYVAREIGVEALGNGQDIAVGEMLLEFDDGQRFPVGFALGFSQRAIDELRKLARGPARGRYVFHGQ